MPCLKSPDSSGVLADPAGPLLPAWTRGGFAGPTEPGCKPSAPGGSCWKVNKSRTHRALFPGNGWDLLPLLLAPALPNKALPKQLCGWFAEGELNFPQNDSELLLRDAIIQPQNSVSKREKLFPPDCPSPSPTSPTPGSLHSQSHPVCPSSSSWWSFSTQFTKQLGWTGGRKLGWVTWHQILKV